VHASEAGPRESLLVLGLARSISGLTGGTVLVLDFDYGGALQSGGGPGILRALEEILDPRGHISRELLGKKILHADDALSYLIFHLPPGDLDQVPEEIFPELLGEAKMLASYVLVRLPCQPGRGSTKLLGQLEQVIAAVTCGQLQDPELPAWLDHLPVTSLSVGFLGDVEQEVPGPVDFMAATGKERAFVFPCREVSKRSLLRLTPYPKEALEVSEPALVQARAVIRQVTRRRLGICLGSGTALGWAHIGVLKVLVRERIAIDCVSASSMGAIVAGLFAMGLSPAEMEAEAARVTEDVVAGLADYNWPVMRDGLLRGVLVEEYLQGLFGEIRIEELDVPLLIQATDLVDGSPRYFTEGSLVQAVRASISLPGIFRPVERDGRFLVDGGVRDTLPTRPLRDMGADLVLAVNTTQSPEFNVLDLEELRDYNVFHLFLRSLEIMQTRRTAYEAMRADYVIQPWVEGPNWKELWKAAEFIRFGEAAAEKELDGIFEMLRSPP
jgi:NTE family protein